MSHIYQAVLNGEEHVPNIDFFTTLAGFVHWRLTGEKVLSIGDAFVAATLLMNEGFKGLVRNSQSAAEIADAIQKGIQE